MPADPAQLLGACVFKACRGRAGLGLECRDCCRRDDSILEQMQKELQLWFDVDA